MQRNHKTTVKRKNDKSAMELLVENLKIIGLIIKLTFFGYFTGAIAAIWFMYWNEFLAWIFLYIGFSVPWGHHWVYDERHDLRYSAAKVEKKEETPKTEIYVFSSRTDASRFLLGRALADSLDAIIGPLVSRYIYYAIIGVYIMPIILFRLITQFCRNLVLLILRLLTLHVF